MTDAKPLLININFSANQVWQRTSILFGVACYITLLNLIYIFHISPYFSYLGYVLHPKPSSYLILAWLAGWLPSLWMPAHLNRPSQVVYWLLYVLAYIPSTFIPFLSLERSPSSLLLLLTSLFLSFSSLGLIYKLPYLTLPRIKLPRLAFWLVFVFVCLVLLAQIIQVFGLRLQIHSLLNVYDVRAEFKETSANPLVGYSVSWLGNSLFPFLISIGFIHKSPLLLALGVFGQLFIFSVTGFKSVFFSSILLISLLIALSNRSRLFGQFVIWGVTSLVGFTWLLDLLTQNIIFSSLFVRRMIITPGILTGWYYDFFSKHPQTLLGHSILEGIVPYPYDRLPPLLIGREYFGNEITYANANFWADAFANFGFFGIAGFTLVLAFVLWMFDLLVKGRGYQQFLLASLLLGVPAITLSNSALIASMVTHGIINVWLILFFLPKNFLKISETKTQIPNHGPDILRSELMTPSLPPIKVVHLTSKHDVFDTRIFLKECKTLTEAGYDVVLIAPHEKSETVSNVKIHAVPTPKNRRERMLGITWKVYQAAISENGQLYHFHDPELIPIGLLLKLRGKKVIYDVHEDLPRQILSKQWVKPYIRRPLAWIMEVVEHFSARVFDGIITVTTTIAKRFPAHKTALVQNFPIPDELVSADPIPYQQRPPIIAYVGGITAIRGIKEMVEAIALLPDSLNAKLVLAGTFDPPSLEDEVKKLPGWEKVEARGWQNRSEIGDLLGKARIGLVVLYPIPNYLDALPIKLFEYMSAGIPVVASNFPLWSEIVTSSECGVLVNPLNPKEIAKAIQYIIEQPATAKKMGELGQQAIKTKYNWSAETVKLLSLYRKIFGQERRINI